MAEKKEPHTLEKIVSLIKRLRGKEGCPWDKKQTPETMITHLLGETYELQDAIASGNPDHVMEELGDVLFQLLFITSIYEERGSFKLSDMIELNLTKMVRRHPHVFGDEEADSVEEVNKTWERIKADERRDTKACSLLDTVPAGMPSLQRAYEISERVGRAGFDWDDLDGVIIKVKEEWDELSEARLKKDRAEVEMEFGDLLFTLTNVARFLKIHPETALAGSVSKFEQRYRHLEKELTRKGCGLDALSREVIDTLWERAKEDTGKR